MARTNTLSASCKLCRRENEKLFLKGDRCYTSKCAIVKRNYVPGFHGTQRQSRLSEYGQQLRAKQKAKRMYGVMERQFITYYQKASGQEDSAIALKRMLEMRFDNVVYRLGFAISRSQSRQMITHGMFTVNGNKMDVPSYQVRVGDVITIKDTKQNKLMFKDLSEKLQQHQFKSWMTLDAGNLEGKIVSLPQPQDLEDSVQANDIIEYYSRF